MELLKTLVNDSVKLGKYRFLKFQNRTFCSKALCSVLRINKNTFSRAIGMNNNNNVATIPGRKSRNREESSLHLMNWLESYATYHEDMMPDEEDIYLPYKTIKVDLYWNYKTETSLPVCKSQFFKTCSSYCPHLQIKKDAGNNTRCYECSDVSLPRLCSHVTECTDGEKCAVYQHVTSSGMMKYDSGCVLKAVCNKRQINIGHDLKFCLECCDGDYCNTQGCYADAIQPSQRGPTCFRCDYGNAPDDCRTVTTCDVGEVCMLTEVPLNDGQNTYYYRSACAKEADCKMIQSFIIGKKRDTLCHTCCTDDYCNDECHHASVSASTMTSPMTSPIPDSTTTAESTTIEASSVNVSTTPPTTAALSSTPTTTLTTSTQQTTANSTTTLKLTTQPNTSSFKDYCHHHHYHYNSQAHLCYRLHNVKKTWDGAATFCKHEGGLLAVVDTQAKWNFLKTAISHHYNENVYIGGRDTGHPDNSFHWTNGANVTLHAWSGDQPDGGNEDCIYVSHTYGWNWHDTACSNHMSFVCTIGDPSI